MNETAGVAVNLIQSTHLCLGISDVFITVVLLFLITTAVGGNILVILSVVLYKRMRTFTNILLTSLASADLLVGIWVMPLALIDLLHSHKWPFGKFLCQVWATSDVMLCTASILNLCMISLDRYMAITSPLKYPRTRSKSMAFGLLSSVWGLSLIVCSPPWLVPGWGQFAKNVDDAFYCDYSLSVPYRIYSALGSFYIPLLVMLSVYFKIFRVASAREALMRQSLGTCRLSRKVEKNNAKNNKANKNNHNRCGSVPVQRTKNRLPSSNILSEFSAYNSDVVYHNRSTCITMPETFRNGRCVEDYNEKDSDCAHSELLPSTQNGSTYESDHLAMDEFTDRPITRSSSTHRAGPASNLARRAQLVQSRPQPPHLVAQAQAHCRARGPGKAARGSKEKMVYLRERKALKTIGIVVLGFIICWMPFFVLYLIELVLTSESHSKIHKILNELFLWLGYSNSVINPLIYTMYNGDFRRCFRDLLSFGCMQQHRRTMSVRKLHQQSTVF
ncbi:hypothetical protein L596_003354 [Steinernema carpocapsae]|uniref:G-protein coupled receptors family 1 profile domain-containing protein n=1 Tax=Steinernema carpocapsae TaxID=34508 RepID=A0A4U8UTW7_STECR|nr:hypothetical protein L596_003354 [Steinernema carpocapsae]